MDAFPSSSSPLKLSPSRQEERVGFASASLTLRTNTEEGSSDASSSAAPNSKLSTAVIHSATEMITGHREDIDITHEVDSGDTHGDNAVKIASNVQSLGKPQINGSDNFKRKRNSESESGDFIGDNDSTSSSTVQSNEAHMSSWDQCSDVSGNTGSTSEMKSLAFNDFMERVSKRAPTLRQECYKLRCFFKQVFLEIQSTDTKANENEVKALPLSLDIVRSKMIAALGLHNNSYTAPIKSLMGSSPPSIVHSQFASTAVDHGVSIRTREDHSIQNSELGTVVDDEAAVMVAKAMELFILELGVRSSVRMDGAIGKELHMDTIKDIIRSMDMFDFLALLS